MKTFKKPYEHQFEMEVSMETVDSIIRRTKFSLNLMIKLEALGTTGTVMDELQDNTTELLSLLVLVKESGEKQEELFKLRTEADRLYASITNEGDEKAWKDMDAK